MFAGGQPIATVADLGKWLTLPIAVADLGKLLMESIAVADVSGQTFRLDHRQQTGSSSYRLHSRGTGISQLRLR